MCYTYVPFNFPSHTDLSCYESPSFPNSPSSCFHITCVLPTLDKPDSERQIPFVSLTCRNWISSMCICMMCVRGNKPKGTMKREDKILREGQGSEWEQNGLWRTDNISLMKSLEPCVFCKVQLSLWQGFYVWLIIANMPPLNIHIYFDQCLHSNIRAF